MYIRTKNRIYKVESETCHKQGYYIDRYEEDVILKDQVIKQSENLEELCDRFVVMDKETKEVMDIVYFFFFFNLCNRAIFYLVVLYQTPQTHHTIILFFFIF